MALDGQQKRQFQQRLSQWYRRYGRDLPWRRTRNLDRETFRLQERLGVPPHAIERLCHAVFAVGHQVSGIVQSPQRLAYGVRSHMREVQALQLAGGQPPRDCTLREHAQVSLTQPHAHSGSGSLVVTPQR